MNNTDLPMVLLVDDERFNLALLERLLHNRYRTTSVSSGQDALDLLAQDSFDLVLLDVMMPQMDGLETLRRIRSNPETADIPVVLISALSEAQDISRGLQAGASDYITKPIDTDVTRARIQTQVALKRLQDERKQTIAELQEVQETKMRLLRMASHDLKGPLMNLRMVNMLLREGIGAIEDGGSLLDASDASIDTMQTVIQDFLDTAAMQTGALDMHIDCVQLMPVIHDLLAEHQANALRKNISLDVQVGEEVIYADVARFHQSLGNLVSNAIKYGPADSHVRLWAENVEGRVTVYVSNEGQGIPASEQHRLFTQGGKLSTRPTGGEASTGMGLWIVKHLITLQNGDVGFIAPDEGGSIFWIRMPVGECMALAAVPVNASHGQA